MVDFHKDFNVLVVIGDIFDGVISETEKNIKPLINSKLIFLIILKLIKLSKLIIFAVSPTILEVCVRSVDSWNSHKYR